MVATTHLFALDAQGRLQAGDDMRHLRNAKLRFQKKDGWKYENVKFIV